MNSISSNRSRFAVIDWIALAVICLGYSLSFRFWGSPWLVLLWLGGCLPLLLREIGWLRDGDEYQQQHMHRAGFHAFLVLSIVLLAGHYGQYISPPVNGYPSLWGRTNTLLRMGVIVYYISYLTAYWGVRQGAFRMLVGVAALQLPSFFFMLRQFSEEGWPARLAVFLGMSGLLVGLGFMGRRIPRLAGLLILALGVLLMVSLTRSVLQPHIANQGAQIFNALCQQGIPTLYLGLLLIAPERDHSPA